MRSVPHFNVFELGVRVVVRAKHPYHDGQNITGSLDSQTHWSNELICQKMAGVGVKSDAKT